MLMPREDPVGKTVFAVTVLFIGLVCFIALMTFLAAVLRRSTERCSEIVRTMPLRAIIAGLVGYAALGGLSAWLYSRAFIERLLETEVVPGMLAATVVVALLGGLATLLGGAGTFSYIGDRLAAVHGGEMSGLKRTALGTLVSVLASWFPLVGWFIVAPALILLSFGAWLLGQLQRLWR